MSLFIKFCFTSFKLNMFWTLIQPRSLRLFYCITTLVVCSRFDVRSSFGVAGLGWYPCSRLKIQPATWIPPQPSHTETPTHIETRTHDQCGDTIEKSQTPDDDCINP